MQDLRWFEYADARADVQVEALFGEYPHDLT